MTAPLRIGIVGCGAIAQAHARALLSLRDATCTALVDRVRASAEALRAGLAPQAEVVETVEALATRVDAAIVCTPNADHVATTRALLAHRVHVLCEKPLALRADEAHELAELARAGGRVLACGLVRRFFGSTELVRDALDRRLLGRPVAVEIEESVRNWPFSAASFDRAVAGGGVFVDMAPHVLDLLRAWIGEPQLLSHEDDAAGGVEAMSRTRLRCATPDGSVPAEVRLYRAHGTRSQIVVRCERGEIRCDPRDRERVQLVFLDASGVPFETEARRQTGDPFAAQLEDFMSAIRTQRAQRVSTRDAVQAVELVERAYQVRTVLPRPWDIDADAGLGELGYERVLVTGATGAVGSRLVEMWAAAGRLPRLRCLIRGHRSAARILRYPVELAHGALTDREAVARAAAGCDAIVHLGVGDQAAEETSVVFDVAAAQDIRRVVHMSSAAVYGRRMPRALESTQEATPLERTGEPYADAKAMAERVALGSAGRTEVVVLRPHMVYGPGLRWSGELLELLPRGLVPVLLDGGTCNLVFVDDLVRAVDRALATRQGLGQPYFVTDGAPLSWRAYIDAHAEAIGVTSPRVRAAEAVQGPRDVRAWVRDSIRPALPILTSQEFRRFVFDSPAVQAALFPLYLRARQSRLAGPWIQRLRQPSATPGAIAAPRFDRTWIEMQESEARLSSARAATAIGWTAAVPFETGLRRVLEWARAVGIVGASAPAGESRRGAA